MGVYMYVYIHTPIQTYANSHIYMHMQTAICTCACTDTNALVPIRIYGQNGKDRDISYISILQATVCLVVIRCIYMLK